PLDAPSATPADIIWGSIRLAGWHLAEGRYPEGSTLPLTLYWRAMRDAPGPIRTRLILEAPDGSSWQRPGFHKISSRYPPERWRSKELVLERWDALLPAGLPGGEYIVILEARDDAGHLLGQQRLGRVEIASRHHMFTLPKPQHAVDARFGEHIRLLGYDVAPAKRPGEPLRVVLYWQATAEIDTSYKVFIHVLNPREHIMGQSDHIPQHGQAPTTSWLPGEVIADEYNIWLSGSADTIEALAVGFYDPRTGQRLPVVMNGMPRPDGRALLRYSPR
ncbi:MAG: hypothetical protein J7M34_12200, partial [Anaerolineae bacterium]|nr:hypothetical protein [Anaerolineae bacterium]